MVYNDDTEMPFGKYKGTKLANVPASYFINFLDKIKDIDLGLKTYIRENRDALLKELSNQQDRID